ncbi:hypothetical protein O3297_09060 [Janthinobacterium sp. SUN128]|uniref:hypothetical protein n=1 Tax=Janthinobacterium sp. SUN128 TaxID=3014790 RepID=UPI0027144287|nr:hypothetical protein [Janthinobacterium sp. SUN128]MDO8033564.1 hypothetical protein [Janthinobacterium sp. SUN128]
MFKKYALYLCFSLTVLSSSLLSNSSYATDGVVLVEGHVECTGVYSQRCGWGDFSGNEGGNENGGGGGGGSGGGGGGGFGSGNVNDGTIGTAMDNNRFVPGCLDESYVIADVIATVNLTGMPVGTYVPLDLKDKLYDNGEWEKWEYNRISDSWKKPDPYTIQKRIRVHYMINRATGAIAQVKLKNSYQSGCEGVVKTG